MSTLAIDITKLDEECAQQPQRFLEAAEAFVEAQSEYKCQKARLELHRASLACEMRGDPEAFGMKKTTEASIAEKVTADVATQTIVKALLDAEAEKDRLGVVKDAYMQRTGLLKAEVDLTCSNAYMGGGTMRPSNVDLDKIHDRIVAQRGNADPVAP